LIVSVCHGSGAAARASAPEVPVERGADREPGSGEALARLAGGQVELEDGPAEWRPFDVDEGDETGVDRIEFGERCVDGALGLGRDEIVVRTEHPRFTPGHGRVDPCAGIGAVGVEVGVEELRLVGVGITACGRDGRGLEFGPPFGGEARQGRGEARSGRVGIGSASAEVSVSWTRSSAALAASAFASA